MLFKLGGHVRFDGVVSAVVGAGCDFVDEDATGGVEEQFHRKKPFKIHGFHDLLGHALCFSSLSSRDRCGCNEVVDKVGHRVKNGFHHREALRFAGAVAGDDDAQFFVDVHRSFEYARDGERLVDARFVFQDDDALAVVPALAHFLYDGEAHGPHVAHIINQLVWRGGDAVCLEELLLQALVLDGGQVVGLGNDAHALLFQRAEAIDAHVLNFDGDAVQVPPEGDYGLGIVEVALHKPVREIAARRIRAGIHDLHPGIKVDCGLNHHAAQLPSAQYADAQRRAERSGVFRGNSHGAKIFVVFCSMEFLEQVFLGNPLREWGIALLWAIGGVVVGKLLYRWFSRRMRKLASKTETQLDDMIVDQVEEPLALAVILLGFWFGYDHLHFGESVDTFMEHVFSIAVAIDVTWMAARLLDSLLGSLLTRTGEQSESAMMAQMAPILRKTLRSTVWVLGVIMAMNNAGYDVGALLAGVGIGGLAMGLAAKDFVANIFGGITIFVDKPFVVGDRVQLDGVDGIVTEVGIRSTRIKTLAGRIVTIPNHKFTDSVVENVTAEPARKIRLDLGLTYDTTPERIEEAIGILREVVEKHVGTENDTIIWFSGFGDFSLNVSAIYYVRKEADVCLTPGAINLEILRRFNAEQLEFAFPTQTLIHQGDEASNPAAS